MGEQENAIPCTIGFVASSAETVRVFKAASALQNVRPIFRIVPDESSLKAMRSLEEEGAQAVIASPGVVQALRENSSVPVIGYFISRYDILMTLKAASSEKVASSRTDEPPKLGLLYFGDYSFDKDLLKGVAGDAVECLNPEKDKDEVLLALDRARKIGVEVVLCGQNVATIIKESGLNPVVIRPGIDSMMLAVSMAVEAANATRGVNTRMERFKEALSFLSASSSQKTRMRRKANYGCRPGTLGEVRSTESLEDGGPSLSGADERVTVDEKAGRLQADYAARSDAVALAYAEAQISARNDEPLLISGEAGTGKQYLATKIHGASRRRLGPLIAVHAKGMPEELLDVELFGKDPPKPGEPGVFEMARGGTVVLIEIGQFPIRIQYKVLSVIKNKVIVCGQSKAIPADVRIIATTSQDLGFMSRMKKFNKELFMELQARKINLVPLRDRPGDIVPLFCTFIKEIALREGLSDSISSLNAVLDVLGIIVEGNAWAMHKEGPVDPGLPQSIGSLNDGPDSEKKLVRVLEEYDWPGNLRELKAFARKYVSLVRAFPAVSKDYIESVIMDELEQSKGDSRLNITGKGGWQKRESPSWPDLEDMHIQVKPGDLDYMVDQIISELLPLVNGNRSELSRRLGISRTTLWKKLSKR